MGDEPLGLAMLKKIRDGLPPTKGTISPELQKYIDKVRLHAWKTTADEVKDLLETYTQDDIYAATMRTALDAGIERFEIGLRALKGAR
jgi:hypothetical protein